MHANNASWGKLMADKKKRRTRRDRAVPIFKERLREVIEASGMSGAELAHDLGLDPRTFNHMVSGNTHPDLMTLKEVSQRCNTSVDYLLGSSDSTMVGKPGIEWFDYQNVHVFASAAAIGGAKFEVKIFPKDLCQGAEVAVRYRGTDLQPEVMPGGIALIDQSDVDEIVNGSIYLIGGEHPFLAKVSRRGGTVMIGDEEAGADLDIQGRVCLIINQI